MNKRKQLEDEDPELQAYVKYPVNIMIKKKLNTHVIKNFRNVVVLVGVLSKKFKVLWCKYICLRRLKCGYIVVL